MTSFRLDAFASRFGWPDWVAARAPLAIGHRGAAALATENTLAAFAAGADHGADMWELDTQLTADGTVVVSHDDGLARVFGVDRRIRELTAADLAALAGVAVPTFAEVAALARARGTGLYVELKAEDTGLAAWRELAAHGQRFAAFGSFRPPLVRELRDAGCPYPLSVLVPVGADPFAMAEAAGADAVHLCWERASDRPQDLVTADLLAEADRRGLGVVLWHEERPEVIADVMALPVVGVCSDDPALLIAHGRHARNTARSEP